MINSILRNAGIRPGRLAASLRGWKRYAADRRRFRALMTGLNFAWGREHPILNEWHEVSGGAGAYFVQDLTVARWIREAAPVRHVDIGSRIDGFIGNVATFRDVEVIDIRPSPAAIPGVLFHQLDVMSELPAVWEACTDSLSCLHTLEHFGLGRYGDTLDPTGYLKGLKQLKRMVEPGGRLYVSTPIGPQRIEFNAHRVFAASTLADWFQDNWQIEHFAVIDDANHLHAMVDWRGPELAHNFGCRTGVGIVAARRLR